MADIPALLAALDVFTRTPDKASLDKANNWLQDFQHSVIVFRMDRSSTIQSDLNRCAPAA